MWLAFAREGADVAFGYLNEVENFGKSSPMGRPAQPVELAPSFVFLASDESRFVNGEILGVTGGQVLA
ncbi:SDR family oxidoreductase [Archangium sp.]|uniref:SDR family oxidoreductase n=1 Tax=Archangium sp. TaxID=1872627 RepID=UPI0038D3B6AF